jgi:His/Glu/Gln/Arg/opine family amino acid ABC transporter permease subunit
MQGFGAYFERRIEMAEWFAEFKVDFTNNFITENRWKYLTNGLLVTLEITLFAVLMGIIIGFVLAIIRTTYDKTGKLGILNFIAKTYITIIRGTPVVLQLLIIYYVVFATVPINKVVAAVIAFGLNSGAYVAEIVRSGIMSIDPGQMEAGRSLGLSYSKTMWYIVLPQAFKTVLPALGNEFITLLKETSVCGYIALADLTKGGDYIRSRTYSAFLPYIAVALIYLGIVMLLSYFVGRLERRLRKSDRS